MRKLPRIGQSHNPPAISCAKIQFVYLYLFLPCNPLAAILGLNGRSISISYMPKTIIPYSSPSSLLIWFYRASYLTFPSRVSRQSLYGTHLSLHPTHSRSFVNLPCPQKVTQQRYSLAPLLSRLLQPGQVFSMVLIGVPQALAMHK